MAKYFHLVSRLSVGGIRPVYQQVSPQITLVHKSRADRILYINRVDALEYATANFIRHADEIAYQIYAVGGKII